MFIPSISSSYAHVCRIPYIEFTHKCGYVVVGVAAFDSLLLLLFLLLLLLSEKKVNERSARLTLVKAKCTQIQTKRI